MTIAAMPFGADPRRSLTRTERAPAAAPGPGWYEDPSDPSRLRYWGGSAWTSAVRDRARHGAVIAPRVRAAAPGSSPAPRVLEQRLAHATGAGAPARRRVSRTHLRWATSAVAIVSTLVLALFGWELVGTNVQGDLAQQHLREELAARTPLSAAASSSTQATTTASKTRAQATPPRSSIPKMPPVGAPVGTIRIPAIGLDYVFSSGTSQAQLARGPGLWRFGAYPGTPGNTTISGHRTTHGGFFSKLGQLHYGDRIYIDIPGRKEAAYAVRGAAVVLPGQAMVTRNVPGVRLTLTTCTPSGWATNRLVIEAELVSGSWSALARPASQWTTLAPPGDAVPLAAHRQESVGQLDPTAR